MPSKWYLANGNQSYIAVERRHLFPEDQEFLDPSVFFAHVERWISDNISRQTLLNMYESLHGRIAPGPAKAVGNDLWPAVRRHLENAFRRGEVVLLRVRQVVRVVHAKAAPMPPVVKEAPKEEKKKTTWIKFRVVEDKTDRPIPGVELDIRLPSGEQTSRTTRSNGLIDIVDLDPGTCNVASVLSGARLTDTFKFVGMGESPIEKGGSRSQSFADLECKFIAEIEAHKVKTGEKLEDLAAKCGMTVAELATFNWGGSSDEEITTGLRDKVGCTKKSRDGLSYVLDSTDTPGIVYLPKPWKKNGLPTEQTHTIRVKQIRPYYLILENEEKLRIPEAKYEAKLSDGSKRSGRLGRSGIALIEDAPPGRIEVEFQEFDEIRSRSFAAIARKAFDDRCPQEILRALENSPQMVKLIIEAYDKYFNDYTGKGLVEDIYQEITDEAVLDVAESMLARAGVKTRTPIEFALWGGKENG
ncbi:MAG TPA: LysM peptidoglycan-binding domain-containing protein [Pyrinomonadaceae bacterium]|jgi:hypothetical protein